MLNEFRKNIFSKLRNPLVSKKGILFSTISIVLVLLLVSLTLSFAKFNSFSNSQIIDIHKDKVYSLSLRDSETASGCIQNSECNTGETCIYGSCFSDVVGFWNFDTDDDVTAFDSSPNGFDGSYVGTLFSASGIYGDALHIETDGDYVLLPYTSSMNFDGSETISISLWANINGSTGYGNSYKMINANGSYRSSYMLEKYSSGGWRFKLDLGSTDSLEWDRDLPHGRYPAANQWYHIVGTYDGSQMRIYINGELDNNASHTGAIDSVGVTDVYVGADYVGMLDEIILMNKTLTNSEVEFLYNLG